MSALSVSLAVAGPRGLPEALAARMETIRMGAGVSRDWRINASVP